MKAHIYAIKNLVNNKMYIGSTKSPKKRKSHHFCDLKYNRHHSYHLQKAYNKYGKENFAFYILEECDLSNRAERETYNISFYKSGHRDFGYNVWEVEEEKFKCSEDTKLKLRNSNQFRSRAIDVYTLDGIFVESFNSLNDCCKQLKFPTIAVSRILNGQRKSFKGLTFTLKGEPFNYKPSSKQRNMNKYK